tara:strand:- start:22904 stop:23257 length:354 start_codon:yes stop_codon:yes gene_type:complete
MQFTDGRGGLTMLENVFIRYKKFSPSYQHKIILQHAMSAVQDIAPTDASIRVLLEETKNGYDGCIRISSSSGYFFAKSNASSLSALCFDLQYKIVRQLERWRELRYSSEQRDFRRAN